MPRRILLIPALAVLAVVPAVALGATHKAKTPPPKTVHVIDDVYTFTGCKGCKASGTSRATISVKPNTTVKWVWGTGNQNSHDVNYKLPKKHAKGLKSFHSELAASDFSYKHKFTKPGTYKIFCSIHTTMRMSIVVKK